MIDMLTNLSIFLAGAGTGAAIGYALWRTITHKACSRARHSPLTGKLTRIAQENAAGQQ